MHVLVLTHSAFIVTLITVSDEVLDYAHQERATLELFSRFLFLNFSLPHRSILLAIPVFDTNKDNTSVQPSPGAHGLLTLRYLISIDFN